LKKNLLLLLSLLLVFVLFLNACSGSRANSSQTVLVNSIEIFVEENRETVKVGEVLQLNVTVLPNNASNKDMVWSVENADESLSREKRAAITQNGKLTGIAEGTVIVKAKATDGSDVEGTMEITVTSHAPVTFKLNLSTNNSEWGTVSGAGCYEPGTEITPTASPAEGYRFYQWIYKDSVISTYTHFSFTMPPENATLTAHFLNNSVQLFTLNLTTNNPDWGVVNGAGVYASGTEVTINAHAFDNCTFIGWHNGYDLVDINNSFLLTVNEDSSFEGVFSDHEIFKAIIYGDQEGAEFLQDFLVSRYDYPISMLYSYDFFPDLLGKGIFIHIVGDFMNNETCMSLCGKSLNEVDTITNEKGYYYIRTSLDERPVFFISIKDTTVLGLLYDENQDFRKKLDEIIYLEFHQEIEYQQIIWESSGHDPKLFRGLFKNPDYSNTELLLAQDELMELTPQVQAVSNLINDKKDMSTLAEIFNLLRAIDNGQSPTKIFEVSASQILSTPILGGCTTFATAFAALARSKGIPSVIIDSADLNWINEGCSLNFVSGHFWVEVEINGLWYLVNSTNGNLYRNYDRSNWFLPQDPYPYIVFAKSLSVIDTGATEESHNPLQQVAFIYKEVNYEEPNYPRENLSNQLIQNRLFQEYQALNLQIDDDFNIDYSGEVFTIKATSTAVDFQNIGY